MIAKYLIGYIATGISFALIDSVWLRTMYGRLYQPEIGDISSIRVASVWGPPSPFTCSIYWA